MSSIAPGVWRISTSLPFRPREVHAYLLQVEADAYALVDGGVNTDQAWVALDAGVRRQVAGGWEQVRAHVVTHMHVDHFGLARRVRDASGAPLCMGELDAERAAHAHAHPDDEARYRDTLLRESGAPAELWGGSPPSQPANPLVGYVAADEPLRGEGGSLPGVPGWSFVWTPGHTAGHVSLVRAADRLLIAGDAVLPHISPTLGVNRQRNDPVGDYLGALQRIAVLEPGLILPGHGEPITDAATRLAQLRAATLDEAARVEALLTDSPLPAWELARRRYAGRELPDTALVQALRETLAHLHRLAETGAARTEPLKSGEFGFARR